MIQTSLNCTVPEFPWLPTIVNNPEMKELSSWNYWALEERERRLTDWALEMEAQLLEMC